MTNGTQGPGHWFDPDQLVIGNYGLSKDQAQAQMAIWSIWSAPMYMSNDLRSIDPVMRAILLNKHLIAINQDELGLFGLMVQQKNSIQAFVKTIKNTDCGSSTPCNRAYAIVYLNRNTLGNARLVSSLSTELPSSPHRHNQYPSSTQAVPEQYPNNAQAIASQTRR